MCVVSHAIPSFPTLIHCYPSTQGVCIDLGRITGGGGKKLQKNINESGYMRISSANAAAWTENTEMNRLSHEKPFLLTTGTLSKKAARRRDTVDVCIYCSPLSLSSRCMYTYIQSKEEVPMNSR